METLNEYMHISEPDRPPRSINKIFIGLLFTACMAIGLMFLLIEHPTDVIKAQLVSLKKEDIKEAYRLTSRDFQSSTPIEKFAAFVHHFPILKKNDGIAIDEARTEENIGYVSGKLKGFDGSTVTIEYQLAKENDHWTIQALRLSGFVTPPIQEGLSSSKNNTHH